MKKMGRSTLFYECLGATPISAIHSFVATLGSSTGKNRQRNKQAESKESESKQVCRSVSGSILSDGKADRDRIRWG